MICTLLYFLQIRTQNILSPLRKAHTKLSFEAYQITRKQENFLELVRKNSHNSIILTTNQIEFFALYILLDSEVKHYKARVYGIIDTVRTLGGIFEFLVCHAILWFDPKIYI